MLIKKNGGKTMKCKNCEHFSFGKCVEGRCYGGCDIDSQNRTVHMESDCIVNVEDLKGELK